MQNDIKIYVSECLTSDQRRLIEKSIASAAERSRAKAEAARARVAEENKLIDRVMAPIEKLIRTDQEAVEALEKLSENQLEVEEICRAESSSRVASDHVIPVSPTDNSVELRVRPFDFAWSWHGGGGAPPFTQIGDRNGSLALDARAGAIQGGADRFVQAHVGVGCIVRIDRPISVELFAARSSRFSFSMGCSGIGSNATSEGGLETTFMRGGEVLMAGTMPLWRNRVSGFETARNSINFTGGTYPDGMGGRIDPGEYAFNVGIWAFADFSRGVGTAGVQSLAQSEIFEMRVHRRG